MLNILLICGGGFSSSFLVQNMKKAAADKDLDVQIQAKAESTLAGLVNNYDVILVTPQLKYNEDNIKTICGRAGVPYALIPSMDFGTMNGPAVLQLALDTIGKEADK
jgi:PTS system cellobiose-specific IIB component